MDKFKDREVSKDIINTYGIYVLAPLIYCSNDPFLFNFLFQKFSFVLFDITKHTNF